MLYNDKLYDLYGSHSTVGIVESRRLQWTGHVTRMRESRNLYIIWVRKHLEKQSHKTWRRGWRLML